MTVNTRSLVALLLLLAMVVHGTALAVPDVIRLHVIAHSDAPGDQEVKELVRDEVVEELGPIFAQMDQPQVEKWVEENQDVIAALATATLHEAGYRYGARVEYGVVDYPTRAYGEKLFPAGKYRSLRVVLGDGSGKNWWCVLFPPLCFVQETSAESTTDTAEVEVRFWLWDKLSDFFGRWL